MPFQSNDLDVNCRFFVGDRPCTWHKSEGAICQCAHYAPIEERVLVIKLDAMGDVLRTTSLLPAIHSQHRNAGLTWITRPESVPLLQHNPLIDEIVPYGPDSVVHLQAREFDRVINMDAGKISAGLASIAHASRKDGYVLHPNGHATPTNAAADAWFHLGVDDTLKRRGTRTYQSWMTDILGYDGPTTGYVLRLRDTEVAKGASHLAALGVDTTRPIVGLNTGAGGRWPLKQWRVDGFMSVIDTLGAEGVQFLLLGGPSEAARNEQIRRDARGLVFDPGSENPVRHFAALVGSCDVVVTGDTLAMHIALALERRTIVLFGPTSAPEIELYNLGEKIVPDMTCLSCYKTACDFSPNCMDLIGADAVIGAVRRQLALAAGKPRYRPAT
jgi:heptosyltransferase-2